MNLAQAISAFARPLLRSTDWYDWRIPDTLPRGILVNPGSSYQRNIDLKHALHAAWIKGDEARRYELACFYVRDWGGIRRNSSEKLRGYAAAFPCELISNGYDGVATWSKILCIQDPNRYAIFDARVSVALNALQARFEVRAPRLFQPLASQNRAIASANARLASRAVKEGWRPAKSETYYAEYLAILQSAGAATRAELHTIEMLLFAHAEELSR